MGFKMIVNVMLVIFNLMILWLLLQNKMKLTNRSFTTINLNNTNKNNWNIWINFFVIPLCSISIITLLYNLFNKINNYYNVFIMYYIPLILFVNSVIYINNKYIGTMCKIIDTQNLNYIEVSIKDNNVKFLFYYIDKTNKEMSFNISISETKRRNELSKKIIEELIKYNYEVYLINVS